MFKELYKPYIDENFFYIDDSELNLQEYQIFILLKPGHYDLLYHKEFLKLAEDIELPDH